MAKSGKLLVNLIELSEVQPMGVQIVLHLAWGEREEVEQSRAEHITSILGSTEAHLEP